MKLCIDLCSGLGGFSKGFKQDPDWEVVTLDINPKFKPSIVADVRFLPFRQDVRPELLLMSPPCEAFSLARNIHGALTHPKTADYLRVAAACFDAVDYLHPGKYMLENPRGFLRWFAGNPTVTIRQSDFGRSTPKPTDLWTNVPLQLKFPKELPKRERVVANAYFPRQKDEATNHSSSVRAAIPFELSIAIKEAVE